MFEVFTTLKINVKMLSQAILSRSGLKINLSVAGLHLCRYQECRLDIKCKNNSIPRKTAL